MSRVERLYTPPQVGPPGRAAARERQRQLRRTGLFVTASALVLVASALGGYRATSAIVQDFAAAEDEAFDRGDLATATQLNIDTWLIGPNRTAEQVPASIRERVYEMQFKALSIPEPDNLEVGGLEPPAIDRLAEIAVPTLVIVGDEDVLEFQDLSARLAAEIPNARHVVMSGVAHVPNMEKPAEFNRLVLDFLGG